MEYLPTANDHRRSTMSMLVASLGAAVIVGGSLVYQGLYLLSAIHLVLGLCTRLMGFVLDLKIGIESLCFECKRRPRLVIQLSSVQLQAEGHVAYSAVSSVWVT